MSQHTETLTFKQAKKTFALLKVQWTKSVERIVGAYLKNEYLAVSGPSSCSKSTTMAALAIARVLESPPDTVCIICANSVTAAKKRIWKCITEMICRLPDDMRQRFRIRAATCSVKIDGQFTPSIELIVNPRHAIGVKGWRVFLFVDDMAAGDFDESIICNLSTNPVFKMIGASNPNPHGLDDPFSIFAKPAEGWKSVDVSTDTEWENRYGKTIIIQQEKRTDNIRFVPSKEQIETQRKRLGENSPLFMSYFRGIFQKPA